MRQSAFALQGGSDRAEFRYGAHANSICASNTSLDKTACPHSAHRDCFHHGLPRCPEGSQRTTNWWTAPPQPRKLMGGALVSTVVSPTQPSVVGPRGAHSSDPDRRRPSSTRAPPQQPRQPGSPRTQFHWAPQTAHKRHGIPQRGRSRGATRELVCQLAREMQGRIQPFRRQWLVTGISQSLTRPHAHLHCMAPCVVQAKVAQQWREAKQMVVMGGRCEERRTRQTSSFDRRLAVRRLRNRIRCVTRPTDEDRSQRQFPSVQSKTKPETSLYSTDVVQSAGCSECTWRRWPCWSDLC